MIVTENARRAHLHGPLVCLRAVHHCAVQRGCVTDDARLYQSVFMTMAEGVVCQAATGEITAVNPAAQRILGRSAEQITGMSSESPQWHAIREDGTPLPGAEHPAMMTLRTGEGYSNVVMGISRADGTRVWISVNSQPLKAHHEARPYAVVTTFHDVSPRIRAEQEIRRLNVR